MKTVEFVVYGVAQPKGSMKSFAFQRPDASLGTRTTSSNKNLGQWAALVRHEAQKFAGGVFFTGAVRLQVDFLLPRPKSLPKKTTDHLKKPDLDKLVRAMKDALTKVIWGDDSQVVAIIATKRYQVENAAPCVLVRAYELTEPKAPNAGATPAAGKGSVLPLHDGPPTATSGQ